MTKEECRNRLHEILDEAFEETKDGQSVVATFVDKILTDLDRDNSDLKLALTVERGMKK